MSLMLRNYWPAVATLVATIGFSVAAAVGQAPSGTTAVTATATTATVAAAPTATATPPSAASPSATATAPSPAATAAVPAVPDDYVAQLIGRKVLDQFIDGKPADAERGALVGAWTSLAELDTAELAKFSKLLLEVKPLADAASRGTLFEGYGRLKRITPVALTDEEIAKVYQKQLFELDVDAPPPLAADDPRRTAYRCEFETELDGGRIAAVVMTLNIPQALRGKTEVDERIGLRGVFVKSAGPRPGEQPVFVARRIAWYPPGLLGDNHFDFALFDDMELISEDLTAEREAHAQLLAAMRTIDSKTLAQQTEGLFLSVPLFNRPADMRGKLVALEGELRRALLVRYPAEDIRERFGFDHYYQVEIFPRDSEGNPVMFHLTELPAGFPEGDNLHEQVRIAGTFLVGYIYERGQTTDEKRKGIEPDMQKAPLLIGKTLTLVPKDEKSGWLEWGISGAVGLLVIGLVLLGWRTLRGDKQAREIMQRTNAPPPGTSLNDLEGNFSNKPDFTGLDADDKGK